MKKEAHAVIPGRRIAPDPEPRNTRFQILASAVFMASGFADCVRAPE